MFVDNNGIKHFKVYYNNGQLMYQYQLNLKNHFEGEDIAYFENGKIKSKCFKVDGQIFGTYINYRENGSIISINNYSSGLQDSISQEYYISGKIQRNLSFLKGKMFGKQLEYDDSGKVKSLSFYNLNGNLIYNSLSTSSNLPYPIFVVNRKSTFSVTEPYEGLVYYTNIINSKTNYLIKLNVNGKWIDPDTVIHTERYYGNQIYIYNKFNTTGNYKIAVDFNFQDTILNITQTTRKEINLIVSK